MINVNINASHRILNAVIQPKAEMHHTNTAVVRFWIFLELSLKIRPAPRKPIPVTTCAIILAGSPPICVEIYVNINEPNNTSEIVLTPIILCEWLRSMPNINPQLSKIKRSKKKSIIYLKLKVDKSDYSVHPWDSR